MSPKIITFTILSAFAFETLAVPSPLGLFKRDASNVKRQFGGDFGQGGFGQGGFGQGGFGQGFGQGTDQGTGQGSNPGFGNGFGSEFGGEFGGFGSGFPFSQGDSCSAVDNILSVMTWLQAPATSFCSNLVASSTAVATVTPIADITTTTVSVTSTDTVFTTVSAVPGFNPIKRAPQLPNVTPAALQPFDSDALATACSCLGIQPAATTTTTLDAITSTVTETSVIATATTTVTSTGACSFLGGSCTTDNDCCFGNCNTNSGTGTGVCTFNPF